MNSYIQYKYSVAETIADLSTILSHGRRLALIHMEEWRRGLGTCVLKESSTAAQLHLHASPAAEESLILQHLTIQHCVSYLI